MLDIFDFLDTIEWQYYDYRQWPTANLDFPDFEYPRTGKDFWCSKRFNLTSRWNQLHVIDLNQITIGWQRRFFALYGIPEKWPENGSAVSTLISTLDSLRAQGGDTFNQGLDTHGLVNAEHYWWLRGHSLGNPSWLEDYDRASRIFDTLEMALIHRPKAFLSLVERFEFHDLEHFEFVKAYFYHLSNFIRAKYRQWVAPRSLYPVSIDDQIPDVVMSAPPSPDLGEHTNLLEFEKWIQITEQIKALSDRGTDSATVLSSHDLSLVAWRKETRYWHDKMAADPPNFVSAFQFYSNKYKIHFAEGGVTALTKD